ncbi:MAG: metallophosphoesterase family protein, partial [Deltaproteobacteria bacterium]|nr:metallophosphoesterase family protein [Deltaproteobacteria bacterium]
MRLLLISDTHGRLGIINESASHVQTDAVIHAGDFGFYDEGSYGRFCPRTSAPP